MDRPIGVIDSGLGGLSVALQIRRRLPHEDIVYACDCGFAPWGEKSIESINMRIDALVDFVLSLDCKALVVACNTATAVAIERLQNELDIPVIGIEPAVAAALHESRTRVVGVLATPATVKSRRYCLLVDKALEDYQRLLGENAEIISTAAPGLMQRVEQGDFEGPETMALIAEFTKEMIEKRCDAIVLGCTHYPFLASAFHKLMPQIRLFDSAPEVAAALESILKKRRILSGYTRCGRATFFTTAADAERSRILTKLWGEAAEFFELT